MAKRRIGEAALSGNSRRLLRRAPTSDSRPSSVCRRSHPTASSDETSAGFTLIELVIVTAVLPLVIGAIAVGVISVFSLQPSVSNRLTDSGDAQVIAIDFQRDVQSATMLTTSSSPQSPAPCGTGVEVLGLQLGPSTEVTYAAAPNGSTYTLSRNQCTLSGGTPTLQNSVVVGRDLPASTMTTSPVTIPQCLQTPPAQIPACELNGASPAYETTWVSPI